MNQARESLRTGDDGIDAGYQSVTVRPVDCTNEKGASLG